MVRPQFSLKSMLWLMLLVAVFFGGVAFERGLRRRSGGGGATIGRPIYGPPITAPKRPAEERKKPSPFKLIAAHSARF